MSAAALSAEPGSGGGAGATFERWRALASVWTAPVSANQPTGTSAKFDPVYELVSKEIAKLESPLGEPVDWPSVMEGGGEVLKSKSKDLLIAGYVARALHVTRGLAGLATGVALMDELIESYWPTLFPELTRLKARANALSWFLDNAARGLSSAAVTASDRADLESLLSLTKHFGDSARKQFGNATPGFRPLLDALDRLRISLPPEAPAAAVAPPPQGGEAGPPASDRTASPVQGQPIVGVEPAPGLKPQPTPSSVSVPSALPALEASGEVTDYLRSLGTALTGLAGPLRQANPGDPMPYRLMRVGLYLGVASVPPTTNGRTRIAPMAQTTRAKLDLLAANSKWTALIDEAESLLESSRFCFDLHRFTALALGALGEGYRDALNGLLAEISALFRRLPGLVSLSFSDGSPLASPDTRAWLDAALSIGRAAAGPRHQGEVSGTHGAATSATRGDAGGANLDEARGLAASGKLPEALVLAQSAIGSAPSGSVRFAQRLELAEILAVSGQAAMARALYEDLDREMGTRGLESWDPPLAVRCLEGFLKALRIAAKSSSAIAARPKVGVERDAEAMIYDRLCRMDPAAALRLGG